MIQGKGLGWVAQHYGWDAGIYMVMGCGFGNYSVKLLWNVHLGMKKFQAPTSKPETQIFTRANLRETSRGPEPAQIPSSA
jgi:hypothetical protein